MENNNQRGTRHPNFRIEIGNRLRKIEKRFHNRAEAAAAAGVAKSTLQNWIEGKRGPSFEGLANLARETGVSLDWLATGEGEMWTDQTPSVPEEPLDEALLNLVVEELERFREERGVRWSAERKARLITFGYAMMLAERVEGRKYNSSSFRFMLKAAS